MRKDLKKSKSIFHKFIVTKTLEDFSQYLGHIEKHLKYLKKQFDEKATADRRKIKDELELSFYDDYISDEWHKFNERYPQILRRSFVISLYAFFHESCLEQNINQMPKQHEILIVKDLRDLFAHNRKLNGRDSRDRKRSERVSKYIDSKKGISIDKNKNIIIENSYCKHVISVLKKYIK